MAVQIKYPDQTRQWIPGHLYRARDGFTISTDRDVRKAVCRDFGNDHEIISQTPDWNVTEWRRWRERYVSIYCEDGPGSWT